MTVRRDFFRFGLMALAAGLGTPALAAETFLLKIKGKVGDSYEEMQTRDVRLEVVSSLGGRTEKTVFKHLDRMRLRTTVDAVKPSGNVITTLTYRSLEQYSVVDDKPLFVFNSQHANIRQLAKDDPKGRALLATLDSRIRCERDSRGRVVDFEVDSPDKHVARGIGSPLEDEIANGDMLFAPGPVPIGQSWEMGPRQFKTSEIGVIRYGLVGKLARVGSMGAERMARVEYVGRDGSLEKSDKYASQALTRFDAEGVFEYSFDRGRITYNENLVKMMLQARGADGHTHDMLAILHGVVEPARDGSPRTK